VREFFNDIILLQPLLSKQDKWKFVMMLGLVIITSFLEAVGIGVIPLFISVLMNPALLAENQWVGPWFSELPEVPSLQVALWASAAMIIFIILKSSFQLFVYYIQSKVVNGYRVRLCERMFCTYQSAPYEWHMKHSSAELLRNIQTDTNMILIGVITPLLDIVMGLTMGGFIVAILMISTPGSTLAGLMMTGVALFFVIRVFQKQLGHVGEVLRREAKGMIQAIQQGFGALIDTRVLGCEEFLANVFRRSVRSQARVFVQRAVIENATALLVEGVLFIGLIVILVILILATSSIESALPIISMLGVATLRLKQVVTKVAASFNKIQASRAFIPSIVNDVMDLDRLDGKQQARQNSEQQIEKFNGLKLENISYRYPDTKTSAINNISLELKCGESIALVGTTGCGKSTLVNLILGLLEPQSGEITVNGKSIFSNINSWRTLLGYIPQSIFLIDDTIRANVAFGVMDKDIDDDKLWGALRLARLEDFVRAEEEGVDTLIGEGGVRLSGGQRQRLGIARALYFNPEVLVMDEATSALDNKTEVEVMEAIKGMKKGRTMIMIAHRLSTVEDCDRLYYLHEGRVEGVGSYSELRQSVPAFAEMAKQKH